MLGNRHSRALKRGTELYLAGDLDGCERTLAALIAALGSPASAAGRRTLGEAWECQARIELDRGDQERAMAAFFAAGDALEIDDANRVLLGRVQYQLATEFVDLPGYADTARDLFASAREHLKDSREYRMLVDRIDLGLVDEDEDWRVERDRLATALDGFYERWGALPRGRLRRRAQEERQQLAWSIMRTMTSLGRVLMGHGDDDEFRTGVDLLMDRADFEVDDISDVEGWLAGLFPLAAVLDRPGVVLPERLGALIAGGEAAARRTGQAADLAAVDFLWGLFHLNQGDATRALRHALRAFVAATELFARTRNTMLRSSQLLAALSQYQHLALTIAVRLDDARLVGELIETSRPQVLPAEGGDPAEGDAPLGTPSHVTVGGVSALRDTAQALGLPERPVLALEDAIAAVGGFHAWWWGSWLEMSELFWATRAPDGTWLCGHRALDETGRQAVLDIAAVYHREGEAPLPHALWTAAAERENARALSTMFLPGPLADVLAAAPGAPHSIVVAGGLASQLPLPTLTIGPDTDVRLVERAVLRVQPPTALVHRAQLNDGDPFGRWPVEVACLDPDGSLAWARHEDLDVPRVLVAPRLVGHERVIPGEPATTQALRAALEDVGRSANATFFYSGHVGAGHLPGDLMTHLVLADGLVSAADFFGVSGAEPLPVPARVVLSACASGGAGGSGSGEWFGLAGGLLVAGARQVVATAWTIPDTEFGAEFDRALLVAIATAPDPARALRDLQVDALVRWRDAGDGDTPLNLMPTPAIFAAYQSIGLLS
jgi:hypothetical protein